MDNKLLLTYRHIDEYFTYEWFQDIEEINDFIKSSEGKNVLEILECIDCSKAFNIDLKELGK
ncbi:hypothetical protein [Clostridium perfringens]|uniref:hypothetical protein n=1 Tax=Clostridium perfringens TaxID=1502 RepID=UPI0023400CD6|nr:hypothetical protein [Clostridium perfringens]MDC4245571.1 hypothetical protein [Clostridium perfringens]